MAKIGAGHVAAMGRLGLRELRAAIHPNSNVAQSPEYGVFGTMTPGEVAEARRDNSLDLEEERPPASAFDQRLEMARSRAERSPDREAPELER